MVFQRRPRANALDTELLHQPLDRATSDTDTLTIELRPDLVCAIDAAILLIHAPRQEREFRKLSASRQPFVRGCGRLSV